MSASLAEMSPILPVAKPPQLEGRYAHLSNWDIVNGPKDGRVGASQIIKDEGLEGKLGPSQGSNERVILITGVSSGLGLGTLKALAATGATIYGTVRNMEKARAAIDSDLLASGQVKLLYMDNTDFSSIRACAEEFCRLSDKLHILINNAGVSAAWCCVSDHCSRYSTYYRYPAQFG